MPIEQPKLGTKPTQPGAPGTWWRDTRGPRPVMRRVEVPGEQTTWEAGSRPSSTQTRVTR